SQGRRCERTAAASSVVAGLSVPPDADTRWRGPVSLGEKTITPSGLQLPPCPKGASTIVCAGPPVTSTILSLPPEKKPTRPLSGDQNGYLAPAVPVSGCHVREFKGRSHSCGSPFETCAPTTSERPSGEIAGGLKLVTKSKAA